MTVQQLDIRGLPRIAVCLANAANTRLLETLLGQHYSLHFGLTEAQDLLITDIVSLQANFKVIRDLRDRSDPVVLPVLVVADSRSRLLPHVAAELGKSVEDILRIPTSQAELTSRINNLLRLRALSRDQDDARQQLVGVVSSLRTLNACDRVVVRSTTEKELLKSLCETIVEEGGYRFAWVGFATGSEELPVEVRAWSGAGTKLVADLKQCPDIDLRGESMVTKTFRSGKTQVIADIATEGTIPQLCALAAEHGIAAAITLPLITEAGQPGCLAIYSGTIGQFGSEERQLLDRLASNLVYGINALRTKREREEQAAEIHYLAFTDPLTGLPNRRHLIHHLDATIAHSQDGESRVALLFVDLDGFKLINDALGHEVGDQVLIQIGQRLQGAVRDSDLVVRQGGDEFLVVMVDAPRLGGKSEPDAAIENARVLAERIIAHLSEPLVAGGYSHRVKASVGISLCPEHGRDAVVLIENADKAMFEAKRGGGGHSHLFSEDISTDRQQRFSMESQLREALDQEQFELYYQPIFELDSCRIVAAEALIRWPREDGSIRMPGAFMPLVEETGLIKPLGDWVLETAARQLRDWHSGGMHLAMAVNLSMKQLYPGGDGEHFAALVRPYVAPSWLHLEVTENALMVDPLAIEALLADLHGKGFQLAVDDFGTGYSSLSRLQHLSIQSLKIDRSFINELGRADTKGTALVAIIQQMASSLNLQTIAEGIETDEQRRLLLQHAKQGDWGQGFWFSRPIPAKAFEQLVRDQKAEG